MENKNCSMNFWWKEIHQQVRISGICKLIKTDSTKEYFYSRPKGSQIAAYLSNQSKRIASYETLIKKYKKIIPKNIKDIIELNDYVSLKVKTKSI